MFFKKNELFKTTRMIDYSDLAYVIPELSMDPLLADMTEPSEELMQVVRAIEEKIDRNELDADNAALVGACFEPCYELHVAKCARERAIAERWLANVELSAATKLTALDEHGETLRVVEEGNRGTDAVAPRPKKRHRSLGGAEPTTQLGFTS